MTLSQNQLIKIARGTKLEIAIVIETDIQTLESKHSFTCIVDGDNFISTYPIARVLSKGSIIFMDDYF